MKTIKIVESQGCTTVFGVGGIQLHRESWMYPAEELRIITKKEPIANSKENSNLTPKIQLLCD